MSNIPQQYILQYEDEMRLSYQFEGNKLRSKVMGSKHEGMGASPADYVAPMQANLNPNRLATTPSNSATVTRRWVNPLKADIGIQIDQSDLTRVFNGGQLQSQYAFAMGKAISREVDDLILSATIATSLTGQTGTGSTGFTSGNIIAANFGASANTGLTVAKLIEAKRIAQANAVDIETEELYCVITSTDHASLLKQIQIQSNEYSGQYHLQKGYLTDFLGVNFIHMDFFNSTYYPLCSGLLASGSGTQYPYYAQLTSAYPYVAGTTTRYLPFFAKTSMYWGDWKPPQMRMGERADLSYAWQIYSWVEGGATRLQEGGVIQINCV